MIAEALIARGFMEAQPERAAMTLEQLPVAQAAVVLRAVPAPIAATVLRGMNVPYAAHCLAHLVSTGAVAVGAAAVAELSRDDASGILRAMEPTQRELLLAELPERTRDPLARALPFAPGTAGAVMDPGIFRLPDDVLVVDARARLAREAKGLLYYVYIEDRQHRLVGVLDIPELMLARPRDPVSVAMHGNVDRINVLAPVALVREHPGWQSYHALPVVDDDDHLLGAIRYQTLRRLEREATGRNPEPGQLTAGALAELFGLGTSGLVAGIAATTGVGLALDRVVTAAPEAAARLPESGESAASAAPGAPLTPDRERTGAD
ncbi:MAG: hypothetical protein WD771_11385 [Gemmatimonadaceae bacterium]